MSDQVPSVGRIVHYVSRGSAEIIRQDARAALDWLKAHGL